ncbi:MAG: hypothetical protein PHR45_09535, partial [Muribaculaceae bacterium]|nr:hypothetical protein [Muribaculaceae bacterium]
MVGDTTTRQRGERGSNGDVATGKRVEDGKQPADNSRGAESDSRQSESLTEPKPIGKGVFGNIYDQFKGKVKEAFDFLYKNRDSDLLGVFHRDRVGDIDLVWGDDTGGFAHIVEKHIGIGKSFNSIESAAKEIGDIISNGKIDFENGDKIVFRNGNKLVTIRTNVRDKGKKIADKNWVLTAYDLDSADGASAISTKKSRQAARATDKSIDKDTQSSLNSNELGDKIAKAEKETIPTEAKKGTNTIPTEVQKDEVANLGDKVEELKSLNYEISRLIDSDSADSRARRSELYNRVEEIICGMDEKKLKALKATVIKNSIEAEEHPDYNKGEDKIRRIENGVNKIILVHRLYGAVSIDGKTYRVKVTMKEDSTSKDPLKPHSYEATKIELLAGTLAKPDKNGLYPNTNNSMIGAKLLKGVEKSFDKGVKILEASENSSPAQFQI